MLFLTIRTSKEIFFLIGRLDRVLFTLFTIASSYVNKLFIFWRKNTRSNPTLTIMEFKTAEEIIKEVFIQTWEKTASKWNYGEYSDINNFLLNFYEFKVIKKVVKLNKF